MSDTDRLDEAWRLLQGQFAYVMSPETYLPGDYTSYYDDIIDRALALAAGSLDAAWAEAEAALPEGWILDDLGWDAARSEWVARAVRLERNMPGESAGRADYWTGWDETPAAALRALAAKLRDRERADLPSD